MELIHVGIDASPTGNAIAIRLGTLRYYRLVGLLDDVPDDECWTVLKALMDDHPRAVVQICTEYPTWSGPGTDDVRAAVAVWRQEIFARIRGQRRYLYCVDPRKWQRTLLEKQDRTLCMKDRSIERARRDWGMPINDDNVADACNIATYCSLYCSALTIRSAERKARKRRGSTRT